LQRGEHGHHALNPVLRLERLVERVKRLQIVEIEGLLGRDNEVDIILPVGKSRFDQFELLKGGIAGAKDLPDVACELKLACPVGKKRRDDRRGRQAEPGIA
jgi:hypothetical protein